jgi:histidine triad (HIT) family protein
MANERARPPGAPCIFCEIVARRANAWIVYEDAQTLAFLDLFPFTRGHLLVVPKRHVDRLIDLDPSEHAAYLGAVAEVCRRVERLSHHYNVAMNQGELAGQIVFHLHVHVIPRYGQGNPFHGEGRTQVTEEEARSVLATLAPP